MSAIAEPHIQTVRSTGKVFKGTGSSLTRGFRTVTSGITLVMGNSTGKTKRTAPKRCKLSKARGPAFFRRRRRRMSDPTSVNPQHHSNAERKENLLTPIQIFSGLLNSPCHILADGFVLNGRVESSCTLRQYCFTSGIAPRIWLCSFLFRFKTDPRNISLILIEGIIRMERRIQDDSILVKIRS